MRLALPLLKVAITAVLLGGMLATVNLHALQRLLGAISPGFIVAAVIALVAQTLVLAARFHVIVAALGRPISASSAVAVSFTGVLFNQALPSAIGGDVLRAWRLRAEGRSWRDAVNSVLLDRGSGVLMLAVLAAAAVAAEPSGVFAPLLFVLWLGVAAGVVAVAVVAAADRLPWLSHGVARRFAASGLPAGARSVFATRVAPRVAALSGASHLLAALAAYWLAAGLGIEVPAGAFLTAALCLLLATMIPLSYAGWGIREAGAVWLFARVGVSAEAALALSILFGAALFVAALPGLWFWLSPSRVSSGPAELAHHRSSSLRAP